MARALISRKNLRTHIRPHFAPSTVVGYRTTLESRTVTNFDVYMKFAGDGRRNDPKFGKLEAKL